MPMSLPADYHMHTRLCRHAVGDATDLAAQAVKLGLREFGFYPEQDCSPLFIRLLEAIKKHGLAMELNTAGLRKDCNEIYPSPKIVGLAAQMGVPITFASDAHAPGEVAMNFTEAVQLARRFGYTHCCRFTRRKRESVPF